MHVVTWGHVTNKKRYISTSSRTFLLNLKWMLFIRRSHHLTNSYVTSKKKLYLCFHLAHDYQTRQDDGSWYWADMHNVSWFFEQVIVCSLVTNKKRYISNSTSPIDIKLDRMMAYDLTKTQKIISLLVKSSWILFPTSEIS